LELLGLLKRKVKIRNSFLKNIKVISNYLRKNLKKAKNSENIKILHIEPTSRAKIFYCYKTYIGYYQIVLISNSCEKQYNTQFTQLSRGMEDAVVRHNNI
jgi:hypothetical protein